MVRVYFLPTSNTMEYNNMEAYDMLYSSVDYSGSTKFLMLRKSYQRAFFLGLPLPFCRSNSNVTACAPNESRHVRSGTSCTNFCICSLLYIQHPFVWGAQDTLQNFSGERFAILPYPLGGSLHSLIFRCRQKREYLSEAQACFFFCQAVAAVRALHTRGVPHGNISSKQLFFIDQAGRRLALSLLERKVHSLGPCATATNEGISVNNCLATLVDQRAEALADIRALGRLLYELCCLEPPQHMCCLLDRKWRCQTAKQVSGMSQRRQTGEGSFSGANASWRPENVVRQQELYPPISQRYRPEVAELVHLLLLGEASALPTAAGILELPFLEVPSKAVAMQLSMFSHNQDGSTQPRDYASPRLTRLSKSALLYVNIDTTECACTRPSFPSSPAIGGNAG